MNVKLRAFENTELIEESVELIRDAISEITVKNFDFDVIFGKIDSGYGLEVTGNTVKISAEDDLNVLYAAYDLKNKYITRVQNGNMYDDVCITESLPRWSYCTEAKNKHRGLWTWGYVIRDYRKYIDRMTSLKLNTLIIWNDYPPENAAEVIKYAHKYGIKIYFGFAWGWDTAFDRIDPTDTEALTTSVIKEYEEKYLGLDCDGIYFQSFTELDTDKLAGITIADAVTDFVNRTAGELLEKYPELEILYGLHASSVRNHLDSICKTDSRISIIWENCGGFPYAYSPEEVGNFSETVEFHDKIKNLRDGGFGAVLKGMTKLDWSCFTHQSGDFVLGEEPEKLDELAKRRKKFWRYLQTYWICNAEYARAMISRFDSENIITFLAEDGAIEAYCPYPLALSAEMMWDSTRSVGELLSETALRNDVKFM